MVLVYDLEIVKGIPKKGETPVDKIQYCNGWGDHAGMGISVLCAMVYPGRIPMIFCDDNKNEFVAIAKNADMLVGFNQIGFDNKVIQACWGVDLNTRPNYDILVEMWKADGLSPTFSPRTHGGYGLDQTCKANFGLEKTGDGALAPIHWQQGKIGNVINYCMNDVRLTGLLLEQIEVKKGFIKSPKNPKWNLRLQTLPEGMGLV